MKRRNAEPVLLAVLAIVALAVAAATLPSTTEGGGGSGSGPPASGSGDGGILPRPEPATAPLIEPRHVDLLLTAIVVIALIAFLVYLLVHRRRALRALLALSVVLAMVAFLFWLASQVDPTSARLPASNWSIIGEPAGSEGALGPTSPPVVLLLVVGAVLLVAVAVLVREGTIAKLGETADGHGPSEDAQAVGRAAGRAADRIEATESLDNEIYRAWLEMTELLDVPRPSTSTPGDFAVAAVEAGMDPDHVGELRRLFEDVRYGGDEPTEPKERRALAILRRVEETYVPDDDEGGT